MQSGTPTAPVSKKMVWAGRIINALPVLMLLFSSGMKLMKPAPVMQEFARLRYPESLALGIGILELVCTIVYAICRSFSACWSGEGYPCGMGGCARSFRCEVSLRRGRAAAVREQRAPHGL